MNTQDESPAQLTQKGNREDGLVDLGTKGADEHCPECDALFRRVFVC